MIVLPQYNSSQLPGMTSVGVQASVFDDEGALSFMSSIHKQLQDLEQRTKDLIGSYRSRAEHIQQADECIDTLEGKLLIVLRSADRMENVVEENESLISEVDKEYEDLESKKEEMEEATHALRGQEVTITPKDVKHEEHLRDFVQEELLKRMQDLSALNDRLKEKNNEYTQEWAAYKKELHEFKEKSETIEEQLDHLNEVTLARFVGMQSERTLDASEKDLTQRIITFHDVEREHRDLLQKYQESQIESRDLEDEIEQLSNQRRLLWKRHNDLDNCMSAMQGTSERLTLRPAAAHADLSVDLDLLPTVSTSEEEVAPSGIDFDLTGTILHRCHKNTHVAIEESISDDNITQARTQVEAGGLDFSTDQIDSGNNKQDDTLPPADPEEDGEQDGQNDSSLGNDGQQNIHGLIQQHIQNITADGESLDAGNQSLLYKFRKRVGGGTSGVGSTSFKFKGGTNVSATGSMRGFKGFNKRGRR